MNRLTSRPAAVSAVVLLAACVASGQPTSPPSSFPSPAPSSSAGPTGPFVGSVPPTTGPSSSPITSGSPSQPSTNPAPWVTIDALPDIAGNLASVTIHAGGLLVGGRVGEAPGILSFDGSDWSAADVPSTGGQVTGIAGRDDGGFVAVGYDFDVDGSNGFIWASDDGATWRSVLAIAGGAAYSVAVDGRTIVVAGDAINPEASTPTAAVWTSTDMATWRRATIDLAGRASIRAVSSRPDGFAAVGVRLPGTTRDSAPLWLAPEPRTWVSTASDLGPKLATTDLERAGDQLVVGGGTNRPGEQKPFVATSRDGRDWTLYQLSDDEGYVSALTIADGSIVAGGVSADRLLLWHDPDGDRQVIELEATGAAVDDLAWDPALGLVAVGARDGRIALWQVDQVVP